MRRSDWTLPAVGAPAGRTMACGAACSPQGARGSCGPGRAAATTAAAAATGSPRPGGRTDRSWAGEWSTACGRVKRTPCLAAATGNGGGGRCDGRRTRTWGDLGGSSLLPLVVSWRTGAARLQRASRGARIGSGCWDAGTSREPQYGPSRSDPALASGPGAGVAGRDACRGDIDRRGGCRSGAAADAALPDGRHAMRSMRRRAHRCVMLGILPKASTALL